MSGVTFGELQRLVGRIVAKGPKFLGGANVLTFLEASAAMLDGSLEALNQGMLLAHPLGCDASALPTISRDRGIRIYPEEPELSKRFRLSRWLQLHRQRGNHQGEMRNVRPYFAPGPYPMMRIVHQDGAGNRATWHTLDAAGGFSIHKKEPSNWDWDGLPTLWSRWWAILYLDGVIPNPALWDDGIAMWDDGVTLWGGITAAMSADLVAMLRDWKAAHSQLKGVAITWNSARFEPGGTPVQDASGWWSHPSGTYGSLVDPTTGLNTRPPDVEWIYEA